MNQPQEKTKPLKSRIEALVLLPNLVLVAFVILYLVTQQASGDKVAPLVLGDDDTTTRIANLELALQRQPADISSAIELARLYREVGEFPWSYNALRNAEASGRHEPAWRLMLGLAYLELGKNKDAVRVLDRTLEGCTKRSCSATVRSRLEIFGRVAHLFLERGIDARRHNTASEKALKEVLKPVEVDPDKMRLKAPAAPKPPPKPEPSDPT
jgi:hypothetical protein